MINFVVCRICGKKYGNLNTHVWKHGIRIRQYKKMFPNEKIESEHTRLKRSKNMKGDKNPSKRLDVRKKMKKAWIKRKLTYVSPFIGGLPKESIEKMKQSVRKGFENGRIVWNKGLTKETDERVRRNAESTKKTFNSPEFDREKWLKNLSEGHKTPKYYEWLKKQLRMCSRKPNYFEKGYIPILKRYGFRYTGDFSYWIGNKNPDFINDEKKLVIELFGNHWHKPEDEGNRTKYFKKYGYRTLVIWGSENKIDAIERIEKFIISKKLGQLLEHPKALDTMNNSNNSKDNTMDNQQPSFYFKKKPRIEEGSETKGIRSNFYFRPKYPRLDILDKDIVRTTRKLVETGRNSSPPNFD